MKNILLFLGLLMTALSAQAQPPGGGSSSGGESNGGEPLITGTVYTACIGCSDAQIRNDISMHLYRERSNMNCQNNACSNGADIFSNTWIYFTDAGAYKGLKYMVTMASNGQIYIRSTGSFRANEISYLNGLSDWADQLENVRPSIIANIAAASGITPAQQASSKTASAQAASEECGVNLSSSSSLDYFYRPTQARIDRQISDELAQHQATWRAESVQISQSQSGGVGVSNGGVSANLGAESGVAVIYNRVLGHIPYPTQNGTLQFLVTDSGGSFSARLDLTQSTIEYGLEEDRIPNDSTINLTPIEGGVLLSSFFSQNSNGDFVPKKGTSPYIVDDCLREDWETALSEMALPGEILPSDTGPGFSSQRRYGCYNQMSYADKYIWTEWITVARVRPDGTYYFVGREVTRSMDILIGQPGYNPRCDDH